MVKPETIGMYDIAKINPVITSTKDVDNYSFIVDDDITYVVLNERSGDDARIGDYTIKAGDYLNGYELSIWKNMKLVVDGKHIDGGIEAATLGATLVADADTGMLKAGTPESGAIGFKVTDIGAHLTEAAVKVRIVIG